MLKTKTTKEQRKFLVKYFCYNSRPTNDERMDISCFINLSPKAVKIWFQNERSRIKKEETLKRIDDNNSYYFSPCCNALCLTPTCKNIEFFESISLNYTICLVKIPFEEEYFYLKYMKND